MKQTILIKLMVIGCLILSASLTINANPNSIYNQPLNEVIDRISEKYEVIITYNTQLLSEVDIKFEFRTDEKLESAVNRALKSTNFKYKQLTEKYHVVYDNLKSSKKKLQKLNVMMHRILLVGLRARQKITNETNFGSVQLGFSI